MSQLSDRESNLTSAQTVVELSEGDSIGPSADDSRKAVRSASQQWINSKREKSFSNKAYLESLAAGCNEESATWFLTERVPKCLPYMTVLHE